jgi:hypothetical protein
MKQVIFIYLYYLLFQCHKNENGKPNMPHFLNISKMQEKMVVCFLDLEKCCLYPETLSDQTCKNPEIVLNLTIQV